MNTEYNNWVKKFLQKNFKTYLEKLKNKCNGKKVVIYCNGIFFDALCDSFNLKKYFNIVGVSDIRYETSGEKSYKGFPCIKPDKLDHSEIILTATPNYTNIKRYLVSLGVKCPIYSLYNEENNLIKNVKILQKDFSLAKYFPFCNTVELKTKLNYNNVLTKLKSKNEKIRLLFVCEENSKWSYQNLYNLFKTDNRFEVLPVVLFPIITKNRVEFTQNANLKFFKELGVHAIDGYDYKNKRNIDIKTFMPDIVFYQQPWYLYGCNHPIEVSKYALTILVPYGYTTLNPKSWGSFLVKQVYSTLWKFFSESPYHNKFYAEAAGMGDKGILKATGSLKFDYYRTSETNSSIWKGNGKRIIWAPHHSINNEGLKMSTFKWNYMFFLEYAKSHQDLSFIVKPHPALKSTCITSGFMNETEYDNYIRVWNSLPNALVYDKGNYFDIFKSSDMLITDCSSFLGEYFPSKHPILLLERTDRADFDKLGKILESGFYKATCTQEIESILEDVLYKNSDPLAKKRVKLISKYLYFGKKQTFETIYEFIIKQLHLNRL